MNEIQETQTLLTLNTCKHRRIQEYVVDEIKTLAQFTIKSSTKIRKPIQLQICNAINMHAFPKKVKSKSHKTKLYSACNQNVVLTNGIKVVFDVGLKNHFIYLFFLLFSMVLKIGTVKEPEK